MSHPLDRPVWNALTAGSAALAVGSPLALRFRPEVNVLAAAADGSTEAAAALAGLIAADDTVGTVEAEPFPPPPGLTIVAQAELAQMVLASPVADWGCADWRPLTDADAAAMFDLAMLTRPGPWRAHSHHMGGFIGVIEDGRLIAMAGERMKPNGWGEVSGVCTHPDARGRGLATALMGVVASRFLAGGLGVFLHAYADNSGAIGLYGRLGFRTRRLVTYTTWRRGG